MIFPQYHIFIFLKNFQTYSNKQDYFYKRTHLKRYLNDDL